MEFVEGETLRGALASRRGAAGGGSGGTGASALARLGGGACRGRLHRDFKSDNVLLRCDGAQLQPLISDFGLARALDHSAGQSSSSGRGLVGTLAYMAPEQLEGQPYTTASDVYSFGLVWYEMLTGELPFKARSSPAVTTLERLTKPVPTPSSQNPLVPAELDPVVLACCGAPSAIACRQPPPSWPALLWTCHGSTRTRKAWPTPGPAWQRCWPWRAWPWASRRWRC